MGNTSSTHMGNTLMYSSFQRSAMQEELRAGVRRAEASEASRSEADSSTIGPLFFCPAFSLRNVLFSLKLFPTSVSGRTNSTRVRFQQLPYQQIRKIKQRLVRAHSFEPDRITDKCFAHKPLAPAPFDLPVATHRTHHQVLGIIQHHSPFRRTFSTINLFRRLLIQPLVRANSVVDFYRSVCPSLLSSQMSRNRPGGLGLQDPMHLFSPPKQMFVEGFIRIDR